jgi:hypothetical protein
MSSTTAYAQVTLYDITLGGSIIGQGESFQEAKVNARRLSLAPRFKNRQIRVHDLDGETIIFECRNGVDGFVAEEGSLFGWTR